MRDSNNNVEKPSKKGDKKEKIRHERKHEKQDVHSTAKAVAAVSESDKVVKHKKAKPVKTNDFVPVDVAQSASALKVKGKLETKAVKEKKRKEKHDKKKDQRQPKEIASGVVAEKQFKKVKKSKTQQAKFLDLTQINFTPNIGFGGSSAWD